MTFDHEIKLDMYLFLLLTRATVQLQRVDRKFSFPYLFFVFLKLFPIFLFLLLFDISISKENLCNVISINDKIILKK